MNSRSGMVMVSTAIKVDIPINNTLGKNFPTKNYIINTVLTLKNFPVSVYE